MKPLNLRIVNSQAIACETAVRLALYTVFHQKRPADNFLSAFLRKNKQYGSRDRRIISECVFAVFRWWGVIRKLITHPALGAIEDSAIPHPDRIDWDRLYIPELNRDSISTILLSAAFLETHCLCPFDIMKIWSERAGVHFSSISNNIKHAKEKKLKLIPDIFRTRKDINFTGPGDTLPIWIADKFPLKYNVHKFAEWMLKRPPLWLRLSWQGKTLESVSQELASSGFEVFPSDMLKDALCVKNPAVNVYTLPSFKNGLFEVQDIASQCIARICNPLSGERWWDACAGAGGKSLHLADLMKNKGIVLASDIRLYKLDDLKLRARRHGYSNIRCDEWNGGKLRKKKEDSFDGVLVDAPCTCSGTWRRNPDGKWRTTPQDVAERSELQLKILNNACPGVKKGGYLVYSTCSVFEDENMGVVKKFLRENSSFELAPFSNPLNGEKSNGAVLINSWDADCDSMFAARFRRTD